jgi:ribosome-binding factor A
MIGRRQERLAEQIKEEVSMIIAGEVEDPRVGTVTVTDARLTPDLRYAKIFVTVLGSEQEIDESLAALKHAAGFIRTQLGAVLRMKRTPELHFVYDNTTETATRIEQILSEEGEKARAREQTANASESGPDSE